jgi:hypothetical protein
MTLQPWLIYTLGMVTAVLGLLVGRRGHYVRAHDIHSSVVAGEVNEAVTITSTETYAAAGKDHEHKHGDRIGWTIAVMGVLVTAAQFAHDVFGFLK